jgi:hypothetical protein
MRLPRYFEAYSHKQRGTISKIRSKVIAIFSDFSFGTGGMFVTDQTPTSFPN